MYLKRINIIPGCQESSDKHICCVQKIIFYVPPISYDERAINVLNRFLEDPALYCLPVIKNGELCGLINRNRFIENNMVGKSGFGYSVNYYKPVGQLIEDSFLQIDQYSTIEYAAELIESRDRLHMYDDICITDNGSYAGIISVGDILSAITKNNLALAIGANPLSGLPGNDFIQRKIRDLLEKPEYFDICYIDIDFFKPYNDRHGFAKGDEVIQSVADILVGALSKYEADPVSFAGHIGGDDFILLTIPERSVSVCQDIIDQFDNKLTHFHGVAEVEMGFYESLNRKEECERFPLLSLSIAIISTEVRTYSSYAEISSVATGLKKKAKQYPGSVVVRDQRLRKPKAFIAEGTRNAEPSINQCLKN